MQAPLRKGKKEETLGRAKGVKRTSRSLLFGLLMVGLVAASSLVYTWQRLVIDTMLSENHALEKELEVIQKRTVRLESEVARLEGLDRIRDVAAARLGMVPLDWKEVIVIAEKGMGGR